MSNTATRQLVLQFDENGDPVYPSVCSPEEFKARGLCIALPRPVVPIIFVPGIMGSNLRNIKNMRGAWTPPNSMLGGLSEAIDRWAQSPAKRQASMMPDVVEVDPTQLIKLPSDFPLLTEEEARRRGWGTVHWDSYGEFLIYLETQLNLPFLDTEINQFNKRALQPDWQTALDCTPDQLTQSPYQHWNPQQPEFEPLTKDEFDHFANCYYPTYAVGYNWLQSNDRSAHDLRDKILEIKSYYDRSQYFKFQKVILISHSMGGLVTRRCQQLPDMESLILGVVHGVMPTHGAPAVYRRLRAGTETNGGFDILGFFVAKVLGWSAADVTCVMAHSPGPLELLPNKQYNNQQPWLHLQAETHQGQKTIVSLPTSGDPYEEIYRQQHTWWRMVDESLIDPASLVPKETPDWTAWASYLKALNFAEQLHDQITTQGKPFHHNTFASYGADYGNTSQQSFGQLTWLAKDSTTHLSPEQLRDELELQESNNLGKLTVSLPSAPDKTIHFRISGKDIGGDGTVPDISGQAVDKTEYGLKQTFRMKGFNHQFSYQDQHVRQTTLYSIAKITKELDLVE
ncbi:hypothetical protein HNQ59_003878 [Chitinivorax tropicus]|uniref:GPI inositol-deacylase PGAP1-like alpha/beta domain-containing protein n=1 Tax=Chitinivorax tropicus TaxID=714531 RepID=A0A840MTJ6_9PROT|nr:hypothetical protein [Chitinivorax tropicus]MBB5020557.1 hypothetical protein [Chitinivorax tropicus]